MSAREEWARLSKVAAEVVRFAPVLMSTRAVAPTMAGVAPNWLMLRSHWGVGANASLCYIFAVNDGTGGGAVTFSDAGGKRSRAVQEATVINEDAGRALPVASGGSSFVASLSPLDVLVIRVRFANGRHR